MMMISRMSSNSSSDDEVPSATSVSSLSFADIESNRSFVLDSIAKAHVQTPPDRRSIRIPQLIAVSKTHPVDVIVAIYRFGQRLFGENYVQELVDKSQHTLIREHCPEIRWHYIGKLQSKKVLLFKSKLIISLDFKTAHCRQSCMH
jgi:uncharacterized pyridoxal phosphate-containing UPF0001 family protein